MINNDHSIYPWHSDQWNSLTKQRDSLAHAILLHGKAGIGKYDFAKGLAQFLLCAQPVEQQACGTCSKCTWFKEGNHPDLMLITPESMAESDTSTAKKTGKKTQISVDQIRKLIDSLSLSNHGAEALRVVLVHPAEALNQASANALLKVLEEPPNNTVFILVTHQLQRLLPTIVSRCQKLALPLPDTALAIDWLKQQGVQQAETLLAYCGGSPLNALDFSEEGQMNEGLFKQLGMGARLDPFNCAALLTKMSMEDALNALQKWTSDILLHCNGLQTRYHKQQAGALQALAKSVNSRSVNISALLAFERTLLQAKKTAQHPLNQELQLMSLLQHYQKIFK